MRRAVLAAALGLPSLGYVSASQERPIAKVLKLLRDMAKQLDKERQDDEKVYDHLYCWCKKGTEEKSALIAAMDQEMAEQKASNEAAFAEMQKLNGELQALQGKIAAKSADITKMEGECMKAYQEFSAEDLELKKTINALKTAIKILGGHHGGFLQDASSSSKERKDFRNAVQTVLGSEIAEGFLADKPEVVSMLQRSIGMENADGVAMIQQPGYASYAPQSGQIFGIMEQMLEETEDKRSAAAKEEEARQKGCEEGLAAGKEELKLMQETTAKKEGRLGEVTAANAEAKAAYDIAFEKKQDAAAFLKKLTAQCNQSKADFESRTKSRNLEMEAINDTVKILDSDEAFKSFGKTLSFAQIRAHRQSNKAFLSSKKNIDNLFDSAFSTSPAERAAHLLEGAAAKSAKVALIQQLVRSSSVDKGAIQQVQKAIDDLVAELKQVQSDEVDFRDECVKDKNRINLDLEQKEMEKEDGENLKATLEEDIAADTKHIEKTQEESKVLAESAAEATKDREEEHAEFLAAAAEQQTTIDILQKAMERLNQVYGDFKSVATSKDQAASLLEANPGYGADVTYERESADTPGSAPAAFTGGGATAKNEGGKKIIALLTKIQDEAKAELTQLTQSEKDEAANYADFMGNTKRSLELNTESIDKTSEKKANEEEMLGETEASLKGALDAQFALTEEFGDMQKRCDFIFKNFDVTQRARRDEIEALLDAKHVLGGAA